MSTEEKRRLSNAIAKLSPEDINKAVEIVAQGNPDFQAYRDDVEINMDVQVLKPVSALSQLYFMAFC